MELLTGMALLAVGVLIGLVISKAIRLQKGRSAALARQLDEVHAEYAAYQEQVDQHFRKTADLLNALSSNYGAMHQHLALGVQTLSQRNLQHIQRKTAPQSAVELDYHTPTQHPETDGSEHGTPSEALIPPKDYAPKAKDDPGLLSHNYVSNKINAQDSSASRPKTQGSKAQRSDTQKMSVE
jgi:uncharacterized membrane-anchored protein YhcB (DUF1043 family)